MPMYKKRLQELAGLLKEVSENITEQAIPMESADTETMHRIAAWLRCIHLWFHGAHHSVRGSGFAGDHVEIYGRVYTEVQIEIDAVIEKIVGVTGEQKMSCPKRLTSKAFDIMSDYASPSDLGSSEMAKEGLSLIEDYLSYLNGAYKLLDGRGKLSLGMTDQWAASASTHETYVYLLRQRVRHPDDTHS